MRMVLTFTLQINQTFNGSSSTDLSSAVQSCGSTGKYILINEHINKNPGLNVSPHHKITASRWNRYTYVILKTTYIFCFLNKEVNRANLTQIAELTWLLVLYNRHEPPLQYRSHKEKNRAHAEHDGHGKPINLQKGKFTNKILVIKRRLLIAHGAFIVQSHIVHQIS